MNTGILLDHLEKFNIVSVIKIESLEVMLQIAVHKKEKKSDTSN